MKLQWIALVVINSYICGASFLFRLLQETRKVEGRNVEGEVGSRAGGCTGPSSYSDAIYSASTVTWQCTAGVSLEGESGGEMLLFCEEWVKQKERCCTAACNKLTANYFSKCYGWIEAERLKPARCGVPCDYDRFLTYACQNEKLFDTAISLILVINGGTVYRFLRCGATWLVISCSRFGAIFCVFFGVFLL